MLSSLTPGFPPAPSLLGCWQASQFSSHPPLLAQISGSGMAEKRFFVAPYICMACLFSFMHQGLVRQGWMESPGRASIQSCRGAVPYGRKAQVEPLGKMQLRESWRSLLRRAKRKYSLALKVTGNGIIQSLLEWVNPLSWLTGEQGSCRKRRSLSSSFNFFCSDAGPL